MRQSTLRRLARAEQRIAQAAPDNTAAARIAALQALHTAGHLVRDGDQWRATDGDPAHERIAELLTLAQGRREDIKRAVTR